MYIKYYLKYYSNSITKLMALNFCFIDQKHELETLIFHWKWMIVIPVKATKTENMYNPNWFSSHHKLLLHTSNLLESLVKCKEYLNDKFSAKMRNVILCEKYLYLYVDLIAQNFVRLFFSSSSKYWWSLGNIILSLWESYNLR